MSVSRFSLSAALASSTLLLLGCETTEMRAVSTERAEMASSIANEAPGDYYIGRRYFKQDYKFWGFVRSPRQPWSSAKLVMMNEQETLAPDRAQNKLGSDNNYEYKLYGSFTGQTVYEPASNGFYPEFALKKYEIVSVAPGNIYRTPGATDPSRRVIAQPR